MFVLGVISYTITFSEISFRDISGIVSEIQYDYSGDSRRRNPSLVIFLESHLEPLKYTAENDMVRNVGGRLKKGDKVKIVVEDIFDDIWGITVGTDEILSFSHKKAETKYGASFLIMYGAFLYIIIFYGKNIVFRINRLKTKLLRKRDDVRFEPEEISSIDDVMEKRNGIGLNLKINPSLNHYNVKFGMKRNKITSKLGKPSSRRTINIGGGDYLDCWDYEYHKIELVFDSDNDFRLSQISFFSNKAEVNDIGIIGLTEKELLEKLPRLRLLDEKDECGYNYGLPGENIQIYVSEGTVDSFCIYD